MSTQSQSGTPRRFPVVPVIVGAVALVLIATVILTFNGGGTDAFGTPTVTGDALPAYGDGVDAAVGLVPPSASGTDFDGAAVEIANDGRPKIILMLAHWCSHCQAEVPVVEAWLDAGNLPDGVDIYSVATGTSETRDNYPPKAWLEREGWSVPLIVDDASYSVGNAFGLTAYPFWVFVQADGTVAARTTGELTPEVLSQVAQGLAG